jgi:hypothetical protein
MEKQIADSIFPSWLTRDWAEYQLDRISALKKENELLKKKIEIIEQLKEDDEREDIYYPMPSVFLQSMPVQKVEIDQWKIR